MRTPIRLLCLGAVCAPGLAHPQPAGGRLETVASWYGPMQTGVTVSRAGRAFVNLPHWGDPVQYTVAEIKNGRAVPYPDARVNRLDKTHPDRCLVSVQSVVVDPRDRLWILDTGSIKLTRPLPGGPELVCVDLATNRVTETIRFPQSVALPSTYLNDARFDLRRGPGGTAYITDSGNNGPDGIIVVDLASGRSWRRLDNQPSVKAAPSFVPTVEGRPPMQRKPGSKPQPLKMGSDGIVDVAFVQVRPVRQVI